jgi:DNA polymerase III delta prime subunit
MLDELQYDPHTPKTVKDIVGNSEIWEKLAKQIREDTVPHIILGGPAGCGKSLFLHIVLEIECVRPVLKIDCTANPGLRDLRDAIRGFSRGSRTNDGHFRWIWLEHADNLASDTQAFLRRMMETTSNTTRFVFECRDAGAISEPVLSRSILFIANAPDETEVTYEIQRRTDFRLENSVVKSVIQTADGNLRKAIIHALAYVWNSDVSINTNELEEILNKRPQSKNSEDWIRWSIEAEQFCKLNGYDVRNILKLGWPNNSHVFYVCSQWSRLGGVSPKTLFFQCIHKIITS